MVDYLIDQVDQDFVKPSVRMVGVKYRKRGKGIHA